MVLLEILPHDVASMTEYSSTNYNIHAVLYILGIIHIAYYWIYNNIYRALQFSKFQKHGGVFYIGECNGMNLAKGWPHLSASLQVCGWAQIDIYSCLFIASKEHVTLSSSFFGATAPCNQGDLRLVGGTFPNRGRVEICLYNMWGTICDDVWGTNDALVVCRQLGFSGTSKNLPNRLLKQCDNSYY